jgi:phosphoribosylamine-glycine ligase
MNVLIIDADRCGLDFALRCIDAGHAVKIFFDAPQKVRDGERCKGLTVVQDWRYHIPWAKDGLVLPTTNTKYLKELDQSGAPVFGPSWQSAQLEIDRAYGMRIFEECGLPVLPYQQFKSLKEAEAFARRTDALYVFKTLGSNEDKSLSFCPSSPEELVAQLVHWQRRGLKLKGPCMLQEKVEMVAEIGVSGWMGSHGWMPGKWNENFEYKKLMPGGFGPNTGEMGSVLKYQKESRLAREMLEPLEDILVSMDHIGDFDVNCGIDAKGRAWPFEPTARLGWPAFYIQVASHKGDPAHWMRDAMGGHDTLQVDSRVAMGVLVAQPPFPYKHVPTAEVEGHPVYWPEEESQHVHPIMMMRGPVPMPSGKDGLGWLTTGEYIACLTSLGATVKDVSESVYGLVDEFRVADKIVRNDIGENLKECLDELHEHGYALGVEY